MGLPAQGLEERGYLPSPSQGNAGESGLDPHYLLYKKKEKQKINGWKRTDVNLCKFDLKETAFSSAHMT